MSSSIEIGDREFLVDLVVLPGLGIDVIPRMTWMSGNGVLIDTSTRVVMLRDPIDNKGFLVQLSHDIAIHNMANATRYGYPKLRYSLRLN
jgi:hypothetical protein